MTKGPWDKGRDKGWAIENRSMKKRLTQFRVRAIPVLTHPEESNSCPSSVIFRGRRRRAYESRKGRSPAPATGFSQLGVADGMNKVGHHGSSIDVFSGGASYVAIPDETAARGTTKQSQQERDRKVEVASAQAGYLWAKMLAEQKTWMVSKSGKLYGRRRLSRGSEAEDREAEVRAGAEAKSQLRIWLAPSSCRHQRQQREQNRLDVGHGMDDKDEDLMSDGDKIRLDNGLSDVFVLKAARDGLLQVGLARWVSSPLGLMLHEEPDVNALPVTSNMFGSAGELRGVGCAGIGLDAGERPSTRSVDERTKTMSGWLGNGMEPGRGHSPNKANLFPVIPFTVRDSRYRGGVRFQCTCLADYGSIGVQSGIGRTFVTKSTEGHHTNPKDRRYPLTRRGSATPASKHIHWEEITLIMEAHIAEPGVSDQLYAWPAVISDVITEEHVPLPEASHLFLEINQDSGTCNYYFAHHGLRTVFWLHALDTISVGLPPSFSSDPSPRIFLHARTAEGDRRHLDALTSETPTFPYTARQSEEFIDLLQRGKDHASSLYVTTYVARLWANVGKVYASTAQGTHSQFFLLQQAIASLSISAKSTVACLPIDRSWRFQITSGAPSYHSYLTRFFFGLAKELQVRFESLWVDQHTYIAPWRKLVSGIVDDLTQMISWAVYLDDRNTTSCSFQPIAIVHSLPMALFVWASLLFFFQGFWMTFAGLPPHLLVSTLFPIGAVLVVVCACIWVALHPRQKPFEDSTLPAFAPPLVPAEDRKEQPTAEPMV
ncbi:hypothetical protein EDB92DRAFT_1818990 [Lactarius akahatsu]|uniref:Uncharacterized protein n=1 Tax=Lactarius akahatsu TaxID=416441 RepID=A0AAD4L8L5_9AGAM|nr:hypothetical protein EDB92DRAFT_1818990 [Lactarius akahatsu]